jgi:hypothetical protein
LISAGRSKPGKTKKVREEKIPALAEEEEEEKGERSRGDRE